MCAHILPPSPSAPNPSVESGGETPASKIRKKLGLPPANRSRVKAAMLNWTTYVIPPEIMAFVRKMYGIKNHKADPQISQLYTADSQVWPTRPTWTQRNPHPETNASYDTPFNSYNGKVATLHPQDPLEAVQSPNFGPHGSLLVRANGANAVTNFTDFEADLNFVSVRIGCGAMACLAKRMAELKYRESSCFGVLKPTCERLLRESNCEHVVPNACDGGALDECVHGTKMQLEQQ